MSDLRIQSSVSRPTPSKQPQLPPPPPPPPSLQSRLFSWIKSTNPLTNDAKHHICVLTKLYQMYIIIKLTFCIRERLDN